MRTRTGFFARMVRQSLIPTAPDIDLYLAVYSQSLSSSLPASWRCYPSGGYLSEALA
jgi:hypothetical protein